MPSSSCVAVILSETLPEHLAFFILNMEKVHLRTLRLFKITLDGHEAQVILKAPFIKAPLKMCNYFCRLKLTGEKKML